MTRNRNFKFDNSERLLAYLIERMTEAKVARKAEEIFFKYVDARKLEYFEIVAFLVSKKSTFNV